MFADITGDGVVDYIVLDAKNGGSLTVYPGNGANQPRNVITKITNGLKAETKLTYESLTKTSHYDRIAMTTTSVTSNCGFSIPGVGGASFTCVTKYAQPADFYTALNGPWQLPAGTETLGKDPNAPVLELYAPMYVVTRVESAAPQTPSISTAMGAIPATDYYNKTSGISYYYSEAKIQASGRGLLGFQKLTTIDEQTLVRTTTTYRQDFPFIGSALRTEVYKMDSAGNKTYIRTADSTWGFNGAMTAPYKPALKNTKERTYDLANGTTVLARVDTGNTYDANGNVTSITVNTYADDGTTLVATKATENSYLAPSGSELDKGRLIATTVTNIRPGMTPALRTSIFSYYGMGASTCSGAAALKGLLCEEVIEPNGGDAYKLTTTHEYDAFGNRAKSTTVGNGVPSRYASWEYDALGRYRERTFNSKGLKVEEVISRNNLAQPTKVKMLNGVVVDMYYTPLGRQYKKEGNDGSASTTLRYLTLGDCPAIGTAMAEITTQAGGGRSIVCYDKLVRPIRSVSTLLNGNVAYVDTEYDNVGRGKFVSEPYFPGAGRDKFIANKYDILGRVLETKYADNTTMGWVYNGLSVTATDALLHTKTETKNALGELVSVTDALGGTISYAYYANGLLKSTTTTSTNVATNVPTSITTTLEYDAVGRKTKMIDPDKGTWTYAYYVNGALKTQTDAKQQTSTMQYDVLGRMIDRIDCTGNSANCSAGTVKGHSTWNYYDDVATNRSWMDTVTDSVTGYSKIYQYDELGRPKGAMTTLASGTDGVYAESVTYDGYGRVDKTCDSTSVGTVCSGLQNVYDSVSGALMRVKDIASNSDQYSIVEIDAKGLVTKEAVGSISVLRSYWPGTSRLKSIDSSYMNQPVQKLSYEYSAVGNLTRRWDQSSGKNVMEVLEYDELNRLTFSTVSGPSLVGVIDAVTYDGHGNIKSKGGVGYSYATNAGPHAVTAVGGTSYTYDANGNNVTGDGRTITYSVFDKPVNVAKVGFSSQFFYDPSRAVYKRLDTNGSQITKIITVGPVEYVTLPDNTTEIRRTLPGGVQIVTKAGTATRRHLLKDHIGSIDVIVNDSGVVEQAMSFDAWGLRRTILQTPNQWQPFTASALATFNHLRTTKGYTGHEMLDEVGIIHMGGRIYDPRLGRFLQADPVLQAPTNTQNYNRYSYVVNNPLTLTDPSGYKYTWLDDGNGWLTVINLVVTWIAPPVGALFGAVISASQGNWMGAIASVASMFAFNAIGNYYGAGAGGATTANLASNSASTYYYAGMHAGEAMWLTPVQIAGRMAMSAAVGGVMSVVQGGKFGNGFAAAGLSSGMSPYLSQLGNASSGSVSVVEVAAAAVLGGTASVITGGKFANGAITGAFASAVASSAESSGRGEITVTDGIECYGPGCSGVGDGMPASTGKPMPDLMGPALAQFVGGTALAGLTGTIRLGGAVSGAIAGGYGGYVSNGWPGVLPGATVGGLTGYVGPLALEAVGTGLSGVATVAATGASAGGLGTMVSNLTTGAPLMQGVGYGTAVGGIAPFVSGEAMAVGGAGLEGAAATWLGNVSNGVSIFGGSMDPGAAHGFVR